MIWTQFMQTNLIFGNFIHSLEKTSIQEKSVDKNWCSGCHGWCRLTWFLVIENLIFSLDWTATQETVCRQELVAPPEPYGEVPDAAEVVGAGQRAEGVVGERVRVQQRLACHTSHLEKPHENPPQFLEKSSKSFNFMSLEVCSWEACTRMSFHNCTKQIILWLCRPALDFAHCRELLPVLLWHPHYPVVPSPPFKYLIILSRWRLAHIKIH